jgi:hypothetical protein
MRSFATSSRLRMTFFSIFTSCASFFARSGPNAPAVLPRIACPTLCRQQRGRQAQNPRKRARIGIGSSRGKLGVYLDLALPKPPRPNNRFTFVDEGGGGGFCATLISITRVSYRLTESNQVPGFARLLAPSFGALSRFDA